MCIIHVINMSTREILSVYNYIKSDDLINDIL